MDMKNLFHLLPTAAELLTVKSYCPFGAIKSQLFKFPFVMPQLACCIWKVVVESSLLFKHEPLTPNIENVMPV